MIASSSPAILPTAPTARPRVETGLGSGFRLGEAKLGVADEAGAPRAYELEACCSGTLTEGSLLQSLEPLHEDVGCHRHLSFSEQVEDLAQRSDTQQTVWRQGCLLHSRHQN